MIFIDIFILVKTEAVDDTIEVIDFGSDSEMEQNPSDPGSSEVAHHQPMPMQHTHGVTNGKH